ncbi:MAG: NAD(P)-dependent oxidoreductase [bacterium]
MSHNDHRAVLTGANGFLGSAILTELSRSGIPTLAITRHAGAATRPGTVPGCETLHGDNFADSSLIRRVKAWQPSVVIHCAWQGVNGRDRNQPFQIAQNLPLTLDTVELAHEAGCSQWIGFGSQAEYGTPNRIVDESAPARPTTLYGKAKLAAGIATLGLCESLGLSGTWLRIFSLYGPGDDQRCFVPYVISEFLQGRAPRVTPCEQLWDYLNVADAARAATAVLKSAAPGVFNLGSGTTVPLRHVVEEIRHIVGAAVGAEYGAIAYGPDQVMHLQADITRLQQAVGWAPSIPLPDGLQECVSLIRLSSGKQS